MVGPPSGSLVLWLIVGSRLQGGRTSAPWLMTRGTSRGQLGGRRGRREVAAVRQLGHGGRVAAPAAAREPGAVARTAAGGGQLDVVGAAVGPARQLADEEPAASEQV